MAPWRKNNGTVFYFENKENGTVSVKKVNFIDTDLPPVPLSASFVYGPGTKRFWYYQSQCRSLEGVRETLFG